MTPNHQLISQHMITDIFKTNSAKSLWTMLVYFVLCFYFFGVIMMVHFVGYNRFDKIHEHIQAAMEIFNHRMTLLCYIPAGVLLFSSIALYWFSPSNFPRWTIISIVILTAISVVTTLFFIAPIHANLPATGFQESIQNKLVSTSLYFQIIPSFATVFLALTLLNKYLSDTKSIAKWLFILAFTLIFYTAGTDYVETLIYYPIWSVIGEKDWLTFRHASGLYFFRVYLIPSYFPLILLIFLNWWRPKGIPKLFVPIALFCVLFILGVSATYFIPKLQVKLNAAFSQQLIDDLNKNQFPLRGIPELIYFILTAFMFVKIGQRKISEDNA